MPPSPIPRRDPDPSGRHPDGLPQTGSFYKSTCDERQIRAWWRVTPSALIGLPMGAWSGVWALDIDTAVDHADDGIAAWRKLVKRHGKVATRVHMTASSGLHLIFAWDAERPIRCGLGGVPKGIEVKGHGGYIVAPPSLVERKQRSYTVHTDAHPIEAPECLIELLLQGRSSSLPCKEVGSEVGPYGRFASKLYGVVDLDELADAMRYVPADDDIGFLGWTKIGMALFAATNGSDFGLELFDEFSSRSSYYDRHGVEARWHAIRGSPPNAIGAGYLFSIARANGWTPPLRRTKKQATYAL